MRRLDANLLRQTVEKLCIKAAIDLPQDIETALQTAAQADTSPLAQNILQDLCRNAQIARETRLPICQDTGLTIVFVEWGQEVVIENGEVNAAVTQGVSAANRQGLLRASIVADPLRRKNTGDNTPPVIHINFVPGNKVKIIVQPKGFGSENMGCLAFLPPHSTPDDIIAHVTECVRQAGANPCPPIVVGIGLGGTAETCCLAAKRALLREIGHPAFDEFYGDLEGRTLAAINDLSIGAQGMGGNTTALAVHIEPLPTHIAGLPVAVNICCHALRHAEEVI